jgi:hypothetical protein
MNSPCEQEDWVEKEIYCIELWGILSNWVSSEIRFSAAQIGRRADQLLRKAKEGIPQSSLE